MENKRKVALIFGVTGQDGSYMAELLNSKGYEVVGVVRIKYSQEKVDFVRSLVNKVSYISIDITNYKAILSAIEEVQPDEIYNFAGITNVIDPFENVDLLMNLNSRFPRLILEAIVKVNKKIKFFQASSCLIFGRTIDLWQNENSKISPIYPYGVAKASADMMIREYRKKYDLFAVSGIFFPHESPRRGDDFFTRRISSRIAFIKCGRELPKLEIGTVMRDWGYAKDYVYAAYLMLQAPKPKDYVIGTGTRTTQYELCELAFQYVGLKLEDHVVRMKRDFREDDVNYLMADITSIKKDLGWKPTKNIHDVMRMMIDADIERLKQIQ